MADLGILEEIIRTTDTAVLTSSARTFTTNISKDFKVFAVMWKFSAAAGNLDVTVDYDSSLGVNYDTRLLTQNINNRTSVVWYPDQELTLKGGDQLTVISPQMSGITVYLTILSRFA